MKRIMLMLCVLFIILGNTVIAQTVIWSEDFESYTDGDTEAVDNNTANPSIDWSFGPGSAVNKVFANNPITGSLSFYHRQGTSTWTTETIDISMYSNVSISINLKETTCEDGDMIGTFYNIDESGPIEFGDGNGDGTFGTVANSVEGLNGNTLVLSVTTTSADIDDKHKFDDILIQGELDVSIEDLNLTGNENNDISIFPNPTSGIICIDTEETQTVRIYNAEGKQVYSGKDCEIDLSKFPNGVYIIKVITEGEVITKKISKQ